MTEKIKEFILQKMEKKGVLSDEIDKDKTKIKVDFIENKLHTKLPLSYRDFLFDFPNGVFFPLVVVSMYDHPDNEKLLPLSEIFGVFDNNKEQDSFFLVQTVDELPQNFIWVGTNEFSDRIILDTKSKNGKIFFWDRTKSRYKNNLELIKIAESFDEFIFSIIDDV